MTSSRNGTFFIASAVALVILMAVIGGVCREYASRIAEYTDAYAARAVTDKYTALSGSDRLWKEKWSDEMKALRTQKWPLTNIGNGLLSAATTLLLGLFWFRIRGVARLRDLHSPSSITAFLMTGTLAWLGLGFGTMVGFMEDFQRGMHHHLADSMGLPIILTLVFFLFLLPVLLIVGWLLLRLSRLPASLWIWDADRSILSAFVTLLFGTGAALTLLALLDAVRNGMWVQVPCYAIILYLVLSTRAAVMSRRSESHC